MWTSGQSDARSSFELQRYDLIDRGFLRRLAERLAYGAAKHGENNYQQGIGDAAYRRDRINHLIEHALKYADGVNDGKDHLAAIAANAMILAFLDDGNLSAQPTCHNVSNRVNGLPVSAADIKGEDGAAICGYPV